MQQEIFSFFEYRQGISIADAANKLSVSEASVRNWIKTGYLESAGKGKISESSFELFISNIAGKDKLTQRANKSQTDQHDHEKLSIEMQSLLRAANEDFDSLSHVYESQLSDSHRNKEGIYYTPDDICRRLLRAPR